MTCRIKVFSYQTYQETEAKVNEWLEANNPQDAQIIPGMAITAVTIPVSNPFAESSKILQAAQPMQIQIVSTFSITVVYKEEK